MKKHLALSLFLLLILQLLCPANLFADNPDLTITNYTNVKIIAGDTYSLKITFKKDRQGPFESPVTVTVGPCSSYFQDEEDDAQEIEWDENKPTGTVTLTLKHDGGNRNRIPIIAEHQGADLNIANPEIPITVVQPDNNVEPEITDEEKPLIFIQPRSTPSGEAGGRVYVGLTLENVGWRTAKNVRIMPVFEDETVFSPDSVNMIQAIEEIEYDKSRNVSFTFMISPKAETKVYSLKFDLRYQDAYGEVYGGTAAPITDTVYISVKGSSGTEGSLSITNIEIVPDDESGVLDANLTVKNTGSIEAKNATALLEGLSSDKLTLAQDTNLRKLGNLAGGAETSLTFRLSPAKNLEAGSYDLKLKLSYEDSENQLHESEQQFFVPVDGQTGKTKPKVILDQYTCSPTIVKAGETFALNMSFLNTSSEKAVRNIRIFLTVPEGDSDNNNSAAAKGSVFTPINSSNTFFIDHIPPNGRSHKTLEFYTIPDASPRTYILTANFEYEDELGAEYKSEEIIGVPVSQQVNIDTSELNLPYDLFVGSPAYISMDFYNTGRANVSNLMINLEGNFQTENARYYVGNFSTGASDYYEATLIPSEPGPLEGAIVISFDDPSGDHIEQRQEFTLEAMDFPMPDEGFVNEMPIDQELNQQNWWQQPIAWAGCAAGVLLLLFIIFRKKGPVRSFIRKKKGITLDE